jgi:hypothetical protein
MTSSTKWPTRAGWLVAFLAPPVAALTVWRSTTAHHPVTTVLLGAAYEFMVAVTRFVAGVTTDLASRWRERLVDSIDLALRRRVSRFGRKYREFVLGGLRFIDLKGLATVGPFTPELAEVFVDVSLTLRPPHLVKAGMLADLPVEIGERRTLGEFLDRTKPVVLAVIGGPGSGKTTLLRHTARQICLSRGRHRWARRVPILLYLRDHVATIAAKPDVTLGDLVRGTLARLGTTEPDGWFEGRLHDGECAVLLDGLDEVARPEDRRTVAAWVERQIHHYPKNDYVITSRPHGYATAGINGAAVLQVRNFTEEQVHNFVDGWYLAVERHSTGTDSQDVTHRASLGAEDLLLRLDHAPALRDLTVNPLLLTMIANVHRYRGALPGSRAELYAEICQVMLFRRHEAKNLVVNLPGDKKESLLRRLAFTMMQQRLSDLAKDEVCDEFKPALDRLPFKVTAEDFLGDVEVSGLLVERESGMYSFAHHTFQEYLAATHIRDKNLTDVIAQAVDDSWWRETILLYASGADADPVIAACLDSDSITALALAFDCADQGSEFAADLRDRLDKLLGTASDPETSPERRRLIIGALLARHLTQLVRASNGSRICPDPITNRLYRFFMEDTHWPSPDGPQADKAGNKPASGMRASDAAAFVQWVNTTMGGPIGYHLPGGAAASDPTIQRLLNRTLGESGHVVWTEPSSGGLRPDGHAVPEVWIPSGVPNPYLIDAATLTAHIRNDINRSISTIARLLVLQSSFMIRILGHAYILDHARNRADALALSQALDDALDRILTNTFDRAFPLNVNLAHALNYGLALDKARVLVLDETVTQNGAFDHDANLARALDRAGAHALRRTLDRLLDADFNPNADKNFARGLETALSHDLDLDRDLALDETQVMDLNRALDRVRAFDSAFERKALSRFQPIIGQALSQGLTAMLGKSRDPGDWSNRFSKSFTKATRIAESYIVTPDTMTEQLATARLTLNELLAHQGGTARSRWAASVVDRLEFTAIPVADRRVQITNDTAISVRLAVLCLAAEADALDHQDLGDIFRGIGAGVTLLERRIRGDARAPEIILLAGE